MWRLFLSLIARRTRFAKRESWSFEGWHRRANKTQYVFIPPNGRPSSSASYEGPLLAYRCNMNSYGKKMIKVSMLERERGRRGQGKRP